MAYNHLYAMKSDDTGGKEFTQFTKAYREVL